MVDAAQMNVNDTVDERKFATTDLLEWHLQLYPALQIHRQNNAGIRY